MHDDSSGTSSDVSSLSAPHGLSLPSQWTQDNYLLIVFDVVHQLLATVLGLPLDQN